MPTLSDYLTGQLQEYLMRPDVVERMKPFQTAYNGALSTLSGFCERIGAIIQRVAESPPSPGYEPWLIEHGSNPIAARGLAHLMVRRGKRIAKDSLRLTEAVKAVRFLASPSGQRRAISRKVAVLLAVWQETSVMDTIFEGTGLDVFEFVRVLESVAKGDELAYPQLKEFSASLAPHLAIPQGPKISAESAAHELFLEDVVPRMDRPRAYSWNEIEGRFTDSITEATRREFAAPDFDPRPAYRRIKARQKALLN